MQTIPQTEAVGTITFDTAVRKVSELAQAKMPESLHGRIQRATALVLSGSVWVEDDGATTLVQSSTGQTWYPVNGHCSCALRMQHDIK